MKNKIILIILLIGLLTACGSQAASTPASAPTEEPAQPTQAVDSAPVATDTSAPEASPVPPTTAPAAGPATVSYSADIEPLLKSRCGSCHGGGRREEGLSVSSYADLMTGSDNGPVIVAGSADDSLLIDLVVSQDMPKRGPKLTPDQTQLIITWVNEGAQNN